MRQVLVKVAGLAFAIVATVMAVELGCPEGMARGAGMLFAALAVICE